MMKKLLTHILFFLILEMVYIIFSVIYSRDISVLGSILWYSILTSILVFINLMGKKQHKWIFIAIVCVINLALTILGRDAISGDMVYLLVISAPINIPFLQEAPFSNIINTIMMRKVIHYVIFFYGALLYWYFAYRLAKKTVTYILSKNTHPIS